MAKGPGGGVVLGPGRPSPTDPPTSKQWPTKKIEMRQRGPKLEVAFADTSAFSPLSPLSPGVGLLFLAPKQWSDRSTPPKERRTPTKPAEQWTPGHGGTRDGAA